MLTQLQDERMRRVLAPQGDDRTWRESLERFEGGDLTLTRDSAGEDAIKSVQRLLIFLGYSTSTTGAFVIDGDFGRGTNRGVAQYQLEGGLATPVTRQALCYDCSFQNARKRIVAIPDTRLDMPTLDSMLSTALNAIDTDQVTFGRLDDALFHLNALHFGRHLSCREIFERYGAATDAALRRLKDERDIAIAGEWVLAIIRQETSGIVRPRFEQHKLSQANRKEPRKDFRELRLRSMSIGLGQIMGFNHTQVGAASAEAMLNSQAEDQILYVARFIARKKATVTKTDPTMADFRVMARYYNGPSYEAHHYHERLQTWFREFRILAQQ